MTTTRQGECGPPHVSCQTDLRDRPDDVDGQTVTGFNVSWWLGLAGMHTLFAREHNVLCDELRSHDKGCDDERVFQTGLHRGGRSSRAISAARNDTAG